MHKRKKQEAGSQTCPDIANPERRCAASNWRRDAKAIGKAPHQHAAKRETQHGEREGKRRIRAGDAEIDLHQRQHDRNRPHADRPDTAKHHGRREPQPSERRLDLGFNERALKHSDASCLCSYALFLCIPRQRLLAQSSDIR